LRRDRLLNVNVIYGGASDDAIFADGLSPEGPTEVHALAGNDWIYLSGNGTVDEADCGAGTDFARADATLDPNTGTLTPKDNLLDCELQDLKPTG
jgi:hypothetical protein